MMDDLPRDAARKICLCMSVTDQEIAACFAAGHRDLEEIRAITRACTRCFGCEADLRSFYQDVLVPGKFTLPRRGWRSRLTGAARRAGLSRVAQRYYHRHVRWRLRPLVFGALVVEQPDLRTRVIIANLDRPGGNEFGDVDLTVQLLDHTGTLVYRREHHLVREATLILEASEMIGGRGKGLWFVGAIVIKGRRRHIGSLRPYMHYYNDVSFASTHDQWTPDATRHHGFCTMVRVPAEDRPATLLAVTNLEPTPYASPVLLANHRGDRREAALEIGPYATALVAVRDLFDGFGEFLEGRLGTVRFANWSHRAMYYFLAHDKERNTWNVNHL